MIYVHGRSKNFNKKNIHPKKENIKKQKQIRNPGKVSIPWIKFTLVSSCFTPLPKARVFIVVKLQGTVSLDGNHTVSTSPSHLETLAKPFRLSPKTHGNSQSWSSEECQRFCPHTLGRWAPRLPLSPPTKKEIPKQKLLVKGPGAHLPGGPVGKILENGIWLSWLIFSKGVLVGKSHQLGWGDFYGAKKGGENIFPLLKGSFLFTRVFMEVIVTVYIVSWRLFHIFRGGFFKTYKNVGVSYNPFTKYQQDIPVHFGKLHILKLKKWFTGNWKGKSSEPKLHDFGSKC